MAGESAVNRSAMATAAQQVESAVGTIRGIQSTMGNSVEELRGGWKGQAAQAFNTAFESFNEDFSKVLQSLETIHQNLQSTQSTYTTTEEDTAGTVGNFGGS